MKKYVIISLKVVVLITLIALAFSVMPGATYLLGVIAGYFSLWLSVYEWSSPVKKQRANRIAYFGNMILFLSIFAYGTISTHITENNTKESIARYMSYTESSEYKQKQEVFKQQFIAMQERARTNN